MGQITEIPRWSELSQIWTPLIQTDTSSSVFLKGRVSGIFPPILQCHIRSERSARPQYSCHNLHGQVLCRRTVKLQTCISPPVWSGLKDAGSNVFFVSLQNCTLHCELLCVWEEWRDSTSPSQKGGWRWWRRWKGCVEYQWASWTLSPPEKGGGGQDRVVAVRYRLNPSWWWCCWGSWRSH